MRITEGDRSAAMQLGISTVVILVIAMVMIGAGISFIRTIFSSGEQVVVESVPSEDLTLQTDAGDPFAVSNSRISAEQGTSTTLSAQVYNSGTSTDTVTLEFSECKSSNSSGSGTANTLGSGITSTSKDIPPGESGGWQAIISLPSDASKYSPFVCNLKANGTTINQNKDIIIQATG